GAASFTPFPCRSARTRRFPVMSTPLPRAAVDGDSWPRIAAALILATLAFVTPTRALAVGTWAPLANAAPTNIDVMLLLPDGTVMAQGYGGTDWYRLTPDGHGSYVNGTWMTLAPMHDARTYFTSQVLRDGRVFVAGGEYGTGSAASEIYDPSADAW